jgi:signal transduction histidine kinase
MRSYPMERLDLEGRVLVLAPIGRDATLARDILVRSGIPADVCSSMDDLCEELNRGCGAALVTQEALSTPSAQTLLSALGAQPAWSDIPLVVLVSGDDPAAVRLGELLGEGANATFLERPTGAATLVRAMHMSLRDRRRQYELRSHLGELSAAREAEHAARALAEDAVRTRDEFLASVAHDLKNPLGGIKGFAQLGQRQLRGDRASDPDKLRENFQRIEVTAARAVEQIDELLDVARLQAGQALPLNLAPMDLVEVARTVCTEWQETTQDHQLRVVAEEPDLPGIWDRPRLERLLSNLVGNAIKYSPDGGPVTIHLREDGDEAVVTVEDEGIGIPPGDLPHVSKRFYRAGNATGMSGTGLGLAGARHIAQQPGGTLAIDSEEGQGTSVTVRLPRTDDVG